MPHKGAKGRAIERRRRFRSIARRDRSSIRALTDAQWIRLRKASAYFAWVHDFSADDLLQEAFCRALAGGRQRPIDIDIGV